MTIHNEKPAQPRGPDKDGKDKKDQEDALAESEDVIAFGTRGDEPDDDDDDDEVEPPPPRDIDHARR